MYDNLTWREVTASTLDAGRAIAGIEMPAPPKVPRKQIIRAIMDQVCQKYGVTRENLIIRCRRKPFTTARFEAMAKIREQTNLSLTEIGRLFDRDHTTVMVAIKRHYQTMEQEQ